MDPYYISLQSVHSRAGVCKGRENSSKNSFNNALEFI
jgi:hypothetical protein